MISSSSFELITVSVDSKTANLISAKQSSLTCNDTMDEMNVALFYDICVFKLKEPLRTIY